MACNGAWPTMVARTYKLHPTPEKIDTRTQNRGWKVPKFPCPGGFRPGSLMLLLLKKLRRCRACGFFVGARGLFSWEKKEGLILILSHRTMHGFQQGKTWKILSMLFTTLYLLLLSTTAFQLCLRPFLHGGMNKLYLMQLRLRKIPWLYSQSQVCIELKVLMTCICVENAIRCNKLVEEVFFEEKLSSATCGATLHLSTTVYRLGPQMRRRPRPPLPLRYEII